MNSNNTTESEKAEIHRSNFNNFTWTKDGITCPKCSYSQRFDDPELREGMRSIFDQRRQFFRQKVKEKYEDRTIKELCDEFNDSRKMWFRQLDWRVNQQFRYWTVFGLTFMTLLKTKRILPTIFAYGLTSYFICPEIWFGKNNEK